MTLEDVKAAITEQLGETESGKYGWVLMKGVGDPHSPPGRNNVYADPDVSLLDTLKSMPYRLKEIPYDPLMGPRDYVKPKDEAPPTVAAGSYKVKDRSGSSLGIAKVLEDSRFGNLRYRLAGQSNIHEITVDEWNKMSPEPSRWA